MLKRWPSVFELRKFKILYYRRRIDGSNGKCCGCRRLPDTWYGFRFHEPVHGKYDYHAKRWYAGNDHECRWNEFGGSFGRRYHEVNRYKFAGKHEWFAAKCICKTQCNRPRFPTYWCNLWKYAAFDGIHQSGNLLSECRQLGVWHQLYFNRWTEYYTKCICKNGAHQQRYQCTSRYWYSGTASNRSLGKRYGICWLRQLEDFIEYNRYGWNLKRIAIYFAGSGRRFFSDRYPPTGLFGFICKSRYWEPCQKYDADSGTRKYGFPWI